MFHSSSRRLVIEDFVERDRIDIIEDKGYVFVCARILGFDG
jgi:hypothetical protein